MNIKDRLLTYIRDTDHVTFAELCNRFPADFADGEFQMSAAPNVVLWAGLSQEAADALNDLQGGGLIVPVPANPLTYLIDGRTLTFPIAKRVKPYKAPHWLPVVWRPMERISDKLRRTIEKARSSARVHTHQNAP